MHCPGLWSRLTSLLQKANNRSRNTALHAHTYNAPMVVDRIQLDPSWKARVGEYLLRDDMQQLGEAAKEHLHPARLGAGALSSMSRLLNATGAALKTMSKKAEGALVYETGEITMAGTLTCESCGNKIQLKVTSVVPKCPACGSQRSICRSRTRRWSIQLNCAGTTRSRCGQITCLMLIASPPATHDVVPQF